MTARDVLTCQECKGEIWDLPHGHKLAKCWGCGLAFDTMGDDEPEELGPDELTGLECTLDGRPAIICGRLLPFAIVATYHPGADRQKVLPGLVAEYAWPTVARVMAAGGAFRT